MVWSEEREHRASCQPGAEQVCRIFSLNVQRDNLLLGVCLGQKHHCHCRIIGTFPRFSFSFSPSKTDFWWRASLGELALVLRANKSSGQGMEPGVALLHLFDTHLCYKSGLYTYSEQVGPSRCCNNSLAATVKIIVSEVFLSDIHQNMCSCH